MRIAQIAPLTESVPPRLYGGTERVVSFLTEQLVAMGHTVTLFASGDSRTSAELIPSWPHALRSGPDVRDVLAPHVLMLEQVSRRADEFDVIHSHLDYWPFSLFRRQSTPFITTLHGRLDLAELRPLHSFFSDVPQMIDSTTIRAHRCAAGETDEDAISSTRPFARWVHHQDPCALQRRRPPRRDRTERGRSP